MAEEYIIFKMGCLFISLLILALATFVKRIVGTWNNPGSLFCLFWFLYSFLPLLSAFQVFSSFLPLLYIFCFCLFFCIPVLFYRWGFFRMAQRQRKNVHEMFANSGLKFAFVLFSLLAMIFLYLALLDQGMSLLNILQVGIVRFAAEYAQKRYTDELVESVWGSLATLLIYPTVAVGGSLFFFARNGMSKFLYVVVSFLPTLFVLLVQNAKGIVFVSFFIFWGAILTVKIYSGDNRLFGRGFALKMFVVTSVIVPLILLSFMSRGISELQDISLIVNQLYIFAVSYSSGHLYAFSAWFDDRYFPQGISEYRQEYLQMGFYTFMSVFQALGDQRPLPIGIYDEFFEVPDVMATNVYTIFRGLISDFGIVGSLFYGLFVSSVIFFFYRQIRYVERSFLSCGFYLFFVMFSYQSFVISSFTWKSIIAAIFVYSLLLWFFNTKMIFRGSGEKNMHG